jgi:peroxiredoxin Q/BCP
MGSALQAGDKAPDFTAVTDSGETLSLEDLRGQRVVLYFYPKDDTPGCTIQSCGFRDRQADFAAKNAVILGVSPDGEASHVRFREKYGLSFPLLVDEDHAIAEAYGVWSEGMVRSHFVIDEDGHVADVRMNVAPDDSPVEALAALG